MLKVASREAVGEQRHNPPARTQVRVPRSHRNSAHVDPPRMNIHLQLWRAVTRLLAEWRGHMVGVSEGV